MHTTNCTSERYERHDIEDDVMAGFIQNILWNSVEGFVDAAKKTGGEYAGNALIKAGDMIEGGGRSVGGGTYPAFLNFLNIHLVAIRSDRWQVN